MTQANTTHNTPLKIREEDRSNLERAVREAEASGDADAISTAHKVRDMVLRTEGGDYSALPPELRASMDKIKALQAQATQLEEDELKPAAEKFERAKTTSTIISYAGMLVAGGTAAYLSGGMAWLPLLAITGVSAIGGLVAGRLITSNTIEEGKRAEGERIFNKLQNLREQIGNEWELINPNMPQVKEQVANHLKVELGIAEPSTAHAAKVTKSSTIAQLAAVGNAAASHATAVQSTSDSTNGCKVR
jgi:hypothetical protein